LAGDVQRDEEGRYVSGADLRHTKLQQQ
jgi:hypothetical protein